MQKEKLLVVVPYRDREEHLKEFIPYIHQALNTQNILYRIVIAEQYDDKLFNRGLLLNAGFITFEKEYDYVCLHDIDTIGEPFDYKYEPVVTHLSAMERRRNYQEWYKDHLGGVTLFPKQLFWDINGFSNNYWGWGKDDDDLKLRCDIMGIETIRKPCKYYTLDHPTLGYHERRAKSPGYIPNKDRLDHFAKTRDKNLIFTDGLNTIHDLCKIYSHESNNDFEWLRVCTENE
jgi:hypothetical protein